MTPFEELYYILGRLECLKKREVIKGQDFNSIAKKLINNPFFHKVDESNYEHYDMLMKGKYYPYEPDDNAR